MEVFSAKTKRKRQRKRSNSGEFAATPKHTKKEAASPSMTSTPASKPSVSSPLSATDNAGMQNRAPAASHEKGNHSDLPVQAYIKKVRDAVIGNNPQNKVVVITAETGSGKSTVIPQFFLSMAKSRIVVTQPRRVAAITLATRVASFTSKGSAVGQLIGYKVRFDDRTSDATKIVYATDGMLLREAMSDPMLKTYSIVFLDEAHERSLQTDILMGIVQRARKQREGTNDPLHVVVMSATLQTATFVDFYGETNTTVLQIPGRQHHVEILYTQQPQEDYREAALSTILQINEHEPALTESSKTGDILVFLPGQEEIEDLASALKSILADAAKSNDQSLREKFTGDHVQVLDERSLTADNLINGVLVCVLYAALSPEVQLAVFSPKPKGCRRRVILATNIAETSVTLPEVTYVVDCGKYKSRQNIAATGLERLVVEDISQAQATQRAGRAGRVHPGLCFRLYTEDNFDSRPQMNLPEIMRVNLAHVVLQLKGIGIEDPTTFEFVTKPDTKSLVRATKLLYALGALNDAMELTDYGRKLAKLPLDPVYGHMLLQGAKYSCVKEMLTAVALLSSDNLFYRPTGIGTASSKAAAAHQRFKSHEGDLPTFLSVYECWRNEAVYVPPSSGSKKAKKKQRKAIRAMMAERGGNVSSHEDWCHRNFISSRSLARAFDIRMQLESICKLSAENHGLGIDVRLTAADDYERLLKCFASGLFLQAASRIKVEKDSGPRSGHVGSTRGRYRTMVGKVDVNIHPTSTMFGRQPAPACVVYTELVATKKTYIRSVTQIKEEWLAEVAPAFYT